MKKQHLIFLLTLSIYISTSCDEFLDKKPRKSLFEPTSLDALQALLEDFNNQVNDPPHGELSADDYFLTDQDWNSLFEEGHRRTYVWKPDYLFGNDVALDWLNVYRNVYTANTIIEQLESISVHDDNIHIWNNIKGQAHFLRARSFLSITNIWTLAYDSETAKNTLGIPLRLESDFNIPSIRSTLEETYDTILKDLEVAIKVLPERVIHQTRPSKAAALALLARTHLFMRNYEKCWKFANESLQINNTLVDYNNIDENLPTPFPQFNEEVLYISRIASLPLLPHLAKIDTNLLSLYDLNDLRKKVLFQKNNDGTHSFKGSYMGNTTLFSGLSTNEVYLMRAESAARIGEIDDSLESLNTLLKNRLDNSFDYEEITIKDPKNLLEIILTERRKELVLRGLRWPDVKRLNKENRGVIMKRNINNNLIELPPNDLRYALPIPEQIIELSGMEQNLR